MGRAGKALRQVLETYGISQNRLAITMGIGRSSVSHWFNETRDPSAEAVIEIIEGLQKLNDKAARDFIKLYLGPLASEEGFSLKNAELD
jgi:transcriptional regulator with XRE-family HTH domain